MRACKVAEIVAVARHDTEPLEEVQPLAEDGRCALSVAGEEQHASTTTHRDRQPEVQLLLGRLPRETVDVCRGCVRFTTIDQERDTEAEGKQDRVRIRCRLR